MTRNWSAFTFLFLGCLFFLCLFTSPLPTAAQSSSSSSSSTGGASTNNGTSGNSTGGGSAYDGISNVCMGSTFRTAGNPFIFQGSDSNNDPGNNVSYCGFITSAAQTSVAVPNSLFKNTYGNWGSPICIAMASNGGQYLNKTLFYPEVDTFGLLQVQGSFNDTYFGYKDYMFRIEIPVQGDNGAVKIVQTSPRRRYAPLVVYALNETAPCLVVPFWTIIVNLNKGVVDGVRFDDDCSACSSDECVDGNCGTDVNKCAKTTSQDATDCDLKVYIAWSGTDSNGQYMLSTRKRLSNFRQWSLNAAYNQASNFAGSGLPSAQPDSSGCAVGGCGGSNGK